jgi:hypothetical protein
LSHDGNSKISNGYQSKSGGREYHRSITIAMPCDSYCNAGNGLPDIGTEERFRDFICGILCADTNKSPVKSYVPWKPEHSLTHNPPRSLDKVMTDECVDQCITNYFLNDGQERKNVYEFLKRLTILDGLYSRRMSDGCYTQYAVSNFGFVDDAIKQEPEEIE